MQPRQHRSEWGPVARRIRTSRSDTDADVVRFVDAVLLPALLRVAPVPGERTRGR